jgi:hypothetical protein
MTRLRACLIATLASAAVVLVCAGREEAARADAGDLGPATTTTTRAMTTMPAIAPTKLISPLTPTTATPASRPSTTQAAAGPPGAAPAAPVLPPEFALFQSRSPFTHGPKKAGGPGGPETGFVFRGVVENGGKFTAFIEDRNAKRTTLLAVGESVARGKVKSVTLDAMEYEAAGSAKRIEVGQDLNGVVVPPTPPASKPAPPGGPPQPGGPSGQPGGPGGPLPPGTPQPGKPARGQPVAPQ